MCEVQGLGKLGYRVVHDGRKRLGAGIGQGLMVLVDDVIYPCRVFLGLKDRELAADTLRGQEENTVHTVSISRRIADIDNARSIAVACGTDAVLGRLSPLLGGSGGYAPSRVEG